MDKIAIKVTSLHKSFKLPHEKQNSIKGVFVNMFRSKRSYERQRVLRDISFEIKKGEFFGIVGRNGSGKSTMLKLLAGIYEPDQGHSNVNGSLTPFIELGVGFNPELTGRENVFLNGALLGFSRKQMDAMYGDIVQFAEIERFMDQKLKNYSSGMQVRLAFSIAIRAKSDILLLDEVLAVGDAVFQKKCFDYFHQLKRDKKTVVFVSHDVNALREYCERGILIEEGEIIESGSINKVLAAYSRVVLDEMDASDAGSTKDETDKTQKTAAPSYAAIKRTAALNSGKKAQSKFSYGDTVYVSFEADILKEIKNPIFGITVWLRNVDKAVFATNTLIEGNKATGVFKPGSKISFTVKIPADLNDGEYFIEPAIANESATVFYDQQPKGGKFYVAGSNNPYGLLASRETIELERQS